MVPFNQHDSSIHVKMTGAWTGYFWELKERSLSEDFAWHGSSLYTTFIDERVVGARDLGQLSFALLISVNQLGSSKPERSHGVVYHGTESQLWAKVVQIPLSLHEDFRDKF